MNALESAVRRCLEQYGLWSSRSRLLCAVSGGADSVALLYTLHRLQKTGGFSLYVSHVQHDLRGGESQADEAFVREICQRWNVPLEVQRAGLDGTMEDPGMETLAREARRRIFARQMEALNADALLTAHHRDDQTETVLMHLLRGAGADGLCGMQPCTSWNGKLVLRPFLNLPKQSLLDALEREGIPHREDRSNQQAITPRNALRLNLLPQLERLFPGTGAHIAQAAATLQTDAEYLNAQADRLYESCAVTRPPLFALRLEPLSGADSALRRRVLRRFWREGLEAAALSPQEHTLSHADTLALEALLEAPARTTCNLPCGLAARMGQEHIHLVHQNGLPLKMHAEEPISLRADCTRYELPHACIVQKAAYALPSDANAVVLPPEWLKRGPVWRTPQPCDRIRPFGAPGHKPLRRYLTDKAVDPCLRPALPVLAVDDEILWIPSLCSSEALRLSAVPDGSLCLQLQGGLFPLNQQKE